MNEFMNLLRVYKLTEFYFSLDPEEKDDFYFYSLQAEHWAASSPEPKGAFWVTNACRFLWTTAANMIPHARYALAEKILLEAERRAEDPEDRAWTQANLAQLYFDRSAVNRDSLSRCSHYCQEVRDSGYFTRWVEQLAGHLTEI